MAVLLAQRPLAPRIPAPSLGPPDRANPGTYIERFRATGSILRYAPAELERAIASAERRCSSAKRPKALPNWRRSCHRPRQARNDHHVASDTIDLPEWRIDRPGYRMEQRRAGARCARAADREYAALRTALGNSVLARMRSGERSRSVSNAGAGCRGSWETGICWSISPNIRCTCPRRQENIVASDHRRQEGHTHPTILRDRQCRHSQSQLVRSPSIVRESVGSLVRNNPATARARGYTWSYSDGGLRVTQRPGPQNALGQMKLDMPNPFTVYLHDTPKKGLFDEIHKTFSHGCNGADIAFGLATNLLAPSDWARAKIATRQKRQMPLEKSIPFFIVYLTVVADSETGVRYLEDPYNLDATTVVQIKTRR